MLGLTSVIVFGLLLKPSDALKDLSKIYEKKFETVTDCFVLKGAVTSKANSVLKCMLRCMNEESIKCLRVQYYPYLRRCDMLQSWDPFGMTYNPFVAFFTSNYLGPCTVYQKVGKVVNA